jgi:tRNA pseudouridine38-40 synthase
MKQRYFIEIAFKGSAFHGWQIQPNAISVQEIINKAISTVLREKIKTVGAGRTDAGVHARCFTAHFDCNAFDSGLKSRIIYGLNSILPDDITVNDLYPVISNAHARFSAISRTYEYRVSRKKNPFEKEFSWFFLHPLNIELMNSACALLQQYNDYTSFSKLHSGVKTNLCKIYRAFWTEQGDILVFTIEADRFLRNMVRAIVGTLIDVGTEKITMNEFEKIIQARNRNAASLSVPAQGLFLIKISYPDSIRMY